MRGNPFFNSTRFFAVAGLAWALAALPARAQPISIGGKLVIPAEDFAVDGDDELDATIKGSILSHGGQAARSLQKAIRNGSAFMPVKGIPISGTVSRGHDSAAGAVGSNTQVNDPALDHVVDFRPTVNTRPFEFSIESETTIINHGKNIVVGYNSSAGSVVEFFPGFGLAFTQLFFTAFSVSHDGGKTWKSGFAPPASPDSPFTFGDPAMASDRHGNIFYASLGTDPAGNSSVNVNKSSDNGDTWTAATVVAVDPGSDKEWIAIGPEPKSFSRDNLYITWTHFSDAGSELWFSKSVDGGNTWATKTLFVPVDDGVNSSFLQFTNPVVDPLSGRLYIPFLHFSDGNSDNVRLLVSDDGGDTFNFVAFNVPGAPDAFAFPNVTPGALNDCTSGGIRNVLHQGPSVATGRFGTFVYTQATRLISQPSAAVFGGRFLFALNTSTSPIFGDPSAGSEIRVIFTKDGGKKWADPLTIAPSTAADPQHVHPAVTLDALGLTAWVGYYAQQSNEQLRTDIARLQVTGNKVKLRDTEHLSTVSFDLTPSNVPLSLSPLNTTNYDRVVAHCYDIGEYMSVQSGAFFDSDNRVSAAWGDNRQRWTGPSGSAAPFEHAQPDVFFRRIGGDD